MIGKWSTNESDMIFEWSVSAVEGAAFFIHVDQISALWVIMCDIYLVSIKKTGPGGNNQYQQQHRWTLCFTNMGKCQNKDMMWCEAHENESPSVSEESVKASEQQIRADENMNQVQFFIALCLA